MAASELIKDRIRDYHINGYSFPIKYYSEDDVMAFTKKKIGTKYILTKAEAEEIIAEKRAIVAAEANK